MFMKATYFDYTISVTVSSDQDGCILNFLRRFYCFIASSTCIYFQHIFKYAMNAILRTKTKLVELCVQITVTTITDKRIVTGQNRLCSGFPGGKKRFLSSSLLKKLPGMVFPLGGKIFCFSLSNLTGKRFGSFCSKVWEAQNSALTYTHGRNAPSLSVYI